MFTKKNAILLATTVMVAGAGGIVATASGEPQAGAAPADAVQITPSPLNADVAQNFARLRAGRTDGAVSEPALIEAAKRQIERDPALGQPVVDYARAVPITVSGDQGNKAWIAPAGEKVCTLLARPGSFGIGCQTVDQIKKGYGLTVAYGSDKSTVISVATDGQPFASLIDDEGTKRALPAARSGIASQNAVATVVPNDQKVAFGDGLIDLGAMDSSK